jgi:hypothetical protein
MYLNTDTHRTSVEAFIDYLKQTKPFDFEVLVKRMYFSIGWPIESIAYVIAQLNEAGFTYPAGRVAVQKVLRKQ